MSSLTIDEKMHLIQKMRRQSETYRTNSRTDISNPVSTSIQSFESGSAEENTSTFFSSIKYRILLSLFLFATFFALHKTNFEIKGHNISEVNTLLESSILSPKLDDSLESFSHQILLKFVSE